MRCHYEVLGIERDAEEAEIKKSYRKAALKWHPDKNINNQEEAKTFFQLIQQAYEVLSDAQERAWYDRHREQILHGSGSDYEDNSLNVYQYFTASCYSGFTDDDEGFYTVFRNVFEQLASEEVEYLDSAAEFEAIPRFGDSKSDYEEVVSSFYAFWQSFCTKKSKLDISSYIPPDYSIPNESVLLSGYAWLSTHNINDIRDRRILKVVEKENKKVQQKARRERNDEIRGLVSFVRKRDKRVQAHRKVLEERAAANRKRQAELDLAQVLKRKEEVQEQMKNQSGFLNDGYEEQLRQLERAMQSDGDDEEDEDNDEEEARDSILADKLQDIHIDMDAMNGDQLDCDEFFCVACNKTFKNQSSFRNHESSKKHKENVELIKLEMLREEGELLTDGNSASEEVDDLSEKDEEEEEVVELKTTTIGKKKKKQKGKQPNGIPVNSRLDSDAEDEESNEFLLQKAEDNSDDDWNAPSSSKTKKSKGKATVSGNNKKEKKSVKQEPSEEKQRVEKQDDTDDEKSYAEVVDVDHKCVTCSEQFSSKNKLFMHLKKTNHGVYLPKGKLVTDNDLPALRKKSKRAK